MYAVLTSSVTLPPPCDLLRSSQLALLVATCLARSDPDDDRVFKPEQIFLSLLGGKKGDVTPIEGTDLYIILVASAQELPDVEELHLCNPDVPIVMFNLKVRRRAYGSVHVKHRGELWPVLYVPADTSPSSQLDTLRGDLGVPAFPPKDLQDRFLSRVRPVYYLRTRQYSRSKATPPFVVNYQGCLFRQYPGQYQTLLDIGEFSCDRLRG